MDATPRASRVSITAIPQSIEAEFRSSKEELGIDHFEVRGWRCIHRHDYVTGLSFLLCSRIRQTLDENDTGRLTIEQVRRSINT